jgi:hypothetical protein
LWQGFFTWSRSSFEVKESFPLGGFQKPLLGRDPAQIVQYIDSLQQVCGTWEKNQAVPASAVYQSAISELSKAPPNVNIAKR